MFCTHCGNPVEENANFCRHCGGKLVAPAPAPTPANASGAKESILNAITAALPGHIGLVLTRGQKTDLEIHNTLADADWTSGRKKVEYSACILAETSSRTIIFWEMIKETGSGMGAFFSFKKETYRSDGKTRSGTVQETGYTPGGKQIDYQWDYANIRQLVETAVRQSGWQFKTVLLKSKATY